MQLIDNMKYLWEGKRVLFIKLMNWSQETDLYILSSEYLMQQKLCGLLNPGFWFACYALKIGCLLPT